MLWPVKKETRKIPSRSSAGFSLYGFELGCVLLRPLQPNQNHTDCPSPCSGQKVCATKPASYSLPYQFRLLILHKRAALERDTPPSGFLHIVALECPAAEESIIP